MLRKVFRSPVSHYHVAMYQPGVEVVCIDPGRRTGLKRGKVYTVIPSNSETLIAIDGFPDRLFHPQRFERARNHC